MRKDAMMSWFVDCSRAGDSSSLVLLRSSGIFFFFLELSYFLERSLTLFLL